MAKIKTMFGFDMETDIGSWTSFYEGFQKGTPIILDILAKHDIKATFYFTADSVKKNANNQAKNMQKVISTKVMITVIMRRTARL